MSFTGEKRPLPSRSCQGLSLTRFRGDLILAEPETESDRDELVRLRRENAELKLDREVLRKAAGDDRCTATAPSMTCAAAIR